MIIKKMYSHLNALAYLEHNHKAEWEEIKKAIAAIDANTMLKTSKAKGKNFGVLYAQKEINKALQSAFLKDGWKPYKRTFYSTDDLDTELKIADLADAKEQKKIILDSGHILTRRSNEIDFAKDKIAIEVQFGKSYAVYYDIFFKLTGFYRKHLIDVGIEIIPTMAMNKKMDSGVSSFEIELSNIISNGRGYPEVPFVLVGIEPETLIS